MLKIKLSLDEYELNAVISKIYISWWLASFFKFTHSFNNEMLIKW